MQIEELALCERRVSLFGETLGEASLVLAPFFVAQTHLLSERRARRKRVLVRVLAPWRSSMRRSEAVGIAGSACATGRNGGISMAGERPQTERRQLCTTVALMP